MTTRILGPASTLTSVARAKAPGTCGELVQGQLEVGIDFLVTFPIDLWSHVQVEITRHSPLVEGILVEQCKTELAIRKTLDLLGYPSLGARFLASSMLPRGKGMASSTADIVAACKATAKAVGRSLSSDQISHIAISIEPSDGIMYPGVVAYNHRQGRLLKRLGYLPVMEILVIDTGGSIDTLEFNQVAKNYSRSELAELRTAYEVVAQGIQRQDCALIGSAATISARINQRLLYKPHLKALIDVAEAFGAYGVNVAHSGTIVGLIFSTDAGGAMLKAEQAIHAMFNPPLDIFRTRTPCRPPLRNLLASE